MSFYAYYPPSGGGANANLSVGPNGDPIPADSTLVGGENPSGDLQPLQTDVNGNLLVNIASGLTNPLPVTDAAAEASLASIDTKLTTTNSTLSGIETNTSDTAVNTADTVTAIVNLDNKSASSDVVEAYDYREFSYVGVTQKIDTIVYKLGGSGGTTVATQTFGYDGSDRLTSITKT